MKTTSSTSLPSRNPLDAYLADIGQGDRLSAEEERELARRLAAGDQRARERLVTCNLGLVVSLAREYQGRGLSLIDLIGEGNIGLVNAADHFDPERGTRFSTFATPCIKQAIKRALLNAGRSIRLPTYLIRLITKWRRIERELRVSLGREPTDREVADWLQIRPKRLERLKEALAAGSMVASREDSLSLDENLADLRTAAPETELVAWETRDLIQRMLSDMDDRDATVIRLRFGLDGHQPRTFKEIGDYLGLTRERIRQIERAVLRRLSNRLLKGS